MHTATKKSGKANDIKGPLTYSFEAVARENSGRITKTPYVMH